MVKKARKIKGSWGFGLDERTRAERTELEKHEKALKDEEKRRESIERLDKQVKGSLSKTIERQRPKVTKSGGVVIRYSPRIVVSTKAKRRKSVRRKKPVSRFIRKATRTDRYGYRWF